MHKPTSATDETDLHHLRRSFVRHLAADGRSAATRSAYATAIAQLEAFVVAQRLPTRARRPGHEHSAYARAHGHVVHRGAARLNRPASIGLRNGRL